MCPEMAALHGPADLLDDAGNFEEVHEFEMFAQEFIEQDKNDSMVTFGEHKELPPRYIMNITETVSNDESLGTIPWSPVKILPAKSKQPPSQQTPSRQTPCDKSQLSLSQKLVHQSQQTISGNIFDNPVRTLASPTADVSVQIESHGELVADANGSKAAAAVALQAEVDQLKKEMTALVFMNNRYHQAM